MSSAGRPRQRYPMPMKATIEIAMALKVIAANASTPSRMNRRGTDRNHVMAASVRRKLEVSTNFEALAGDLVGAVDEIVEAYVERMFAEEPELAGQRPEMLDTFR